MLAFEEFPLWLNGAIFAVAAGIVWLAGTRLTRYADAIAQRTRFGHALIGALLLGGITSLPELATTSTAALVGNAPLAVNNILGGVAMQVAILALADAVIGDEGLSTVAGASSLLLQGNGLMLALALAAAGITSGSVVVLGVDLWTTFLIVVVILVFTSIRRYEQHPYWRPEDGIDGRPPSHDGGDERDTLAGTTTDRIVAYTVVTGAVVVTAGYVLTRTADAMSVQTGLGAGFVGAIFLAAATSLPEVSTTVEAARRRRHALAFSNIFGTNLLDAGFLFVADLLFTDAAVLSEVGDFSVFAALLGILLTGTYVAGILHRGKPVVMRMGIDSALVLVFYPVGAVILYGLR